MAKRNRPIQLHFMVSPQERKIIEARMEWIGTQNLGAYLRKMAVHGHLIRHDMSDIREMVRLLRVTSNSLNQLTKRVHETGNVYAVDIEGLRENYEKLWDLAEETLQTLNRL